MTEKEEIEQIKTDLERAAYVDRLLPKIKVQGYRSFAERFPIVYTPQELIFMEKLPVKIRPTPEQVDLWNKVMLEWLPLLTTLERSLAWKRAHRIPWKLLCRDFGVTRQRLWIMHNRALVKIQFSIKKCC